MDAKTVKRAVSNAILRNDLEGVKTSYSYIITLEEHDKDRALANALWLACDVDRYEIARYLLETGVGPDVRIRDGKTPLMASASKGIVELLTTDFKGDVNVRDEFDRTALMFAKQVEVAEALLQRGAALEFTDNVGRTALMHAIGSDGSGKIAMSLLEHGANPEACDKKLRTILMLAALDCQPSIVRDVLRRGTLVERTDQEGRNALHCICESPKIASRCRDISENVTKKAATETIDIILEVSGEEVVNAKDYRARTPLHLAVASNNPLFVKRLLQDKGLKTLINVRDQRERTPLQTAANDDRADIASILLQHGADINQRSDAGLTPLHVAASRKRNTVKAARVFLQHGMDINCLTAKGQSALHIASTSDNVEVVNLLLNHRKVDITKKDKSGNTPLMCAVAAGNVRIITLLSRDGSQALTHAQLEASEPYRATIIDFTPPRPQAMTESNDSHLGKRQSVSVKSLLTGDVPVKAPSPQFRSKHPGERKTIRWIHLPANNVVWCQEILMRWFMEELPRDTNHFKRLQQSFNREHSGPEMHSYYMRPVFEAIANNTNINTGRQSEYQSDKSTRDYKGSENSRPAGDGCQHHTSIDVKQATTSKTMYLFMPFVHWESLSMQRSRQRAVDCVKSKVASNVRYSDLSDIFETDPEAKLIQAHYHPKKCSVHIPRTLDQFHRPSIKARPHYDRDQVVRRQQIIDDLDADPCLLMIDQLWLWVVSDDLIITSFPRPWQRRAMPSVTHDVLQDITAEISDSITGTWRITDVCDLAIAIAGRCFATYEIPMAGGLSYIELFEATVQRVMEGETRIYNAFAQASSEASIWVMNPGSSKPESVRQNLLDIISRSQRVLHEVKDIRDEMNTLRSIYEQQQRLLDVMGQHILDNFALSRDESSSISRAKLEMSIQEQRIRVSNLVTDIQFLDKQADRISMSIKELLELKESFVNALQVADSSNQNQALMVFTIVTVIFSPLSFLTSFFALNVKEFPHDAQGNTEYPLGYVKKYVIGVGLAFALPCVIYALTLNRLSYLGRKWANSCLQLWKPVIEFFKTKTSKPPSEENGLEAGPAENPDWRHEEATNQTRSSISTSSIPRTSTGAAGGTYGSSDVAVQTLHRDSTPHSAQAIRHSGPPRTYSRPDMVRPNWAQMEVEMKRRSQRVRPLEK